MKEDKKLRAKLIAIITASSLGLSEEDVADFDLEDLQDLADQCDDVDVDDEDEEEEEEVVVTKPAKKAAPVKKEEKPAKKKPAVVIEEEDDEEEEEIEEEEVEVKQLKESKAVKAAKEKKEARKKEFVPKIDHSSKALKPLYSLMKKSGAISKDLTKGVTFYMSGKAIFSYDFLKTVGDSFSGGLYFNSLKGIEDCQKALPKSFLKENELVKYSPNLCFVRNMTPQDVIDLLVEQEVLEVLLNATSKSVVKANTNKEKMVEDLKKGKAATASKSTTKSKAQPAEEFEGEQEEEEEDDDEDFAPVVSKGKVKTAVPAKKAAATVPAKKKK